MMDSQENALQQGTMAEEQQEAVAAAEEVQNTTAELQADNDTAEPVAKQTFKYTADGSVGLLDGHQKVAYIQSSGSDYEHDLRYVRYSWSVRFVCNKNQPN